MLGSPPPVMTSELQVNYRVTISRPTQRLAAQNAYNEGCTEEATLSLNVACLLYLKRKSLVKGSKVKCEIWKVNRYPFLFSEGFDYNEEERYDCKGGELFGSQRRFPGHLFWDFQV